MYHRDVEALMAELESQMKPEKPHHRGPFHDVLGDDVPASVFWDGKRCGIRWIYRLDTSTDAIAGCFAAHDDKAGARYP